MASSSNDVLAALSSLGSSKTNITGVGLDGGLNLKGEAQRLSPPATTRSDNAWYLSPGNVQQLPPVYSVFNDAPTPYPPYHVYNLSTRDLSAPAPLGDLLCHGEYNDTGYQTDAGNLATGWTRPLWASNTARTVSYEQACLPFSLRVRPLATPIGISASSAYRAPTVYGNNLLMAREEGNPPRRRFLCGSILNFVFNASAGYVDGLSRTFTFQYGSNLVAADMLGVQNSASGGTGSNGYAALLAVGSSTTTLYSVSYNGGQVGSVTIATPPNYNAPTAQLFHHAGRTYLGYAGTSTNTAAFFRDIVAATTTQITTNSTTTPNNFAVSSPYTHQSSSSVTYLAMIYNNALYVVAQGTTGQFNIVAGPVALASPTTVPSAGTYNYAATVQAMVADATGGVGPGAKLVIATFTHYPETASGDFSNAFYQSVQCGKYTFTAAATNPATAAGTLVNNATNIFRTVAGAGLVSKAFCTNPAEANFAGPTAARHALCVVQSGAVEPDVTTVHKGSSASGLLLDRESQPTFFIIDHNADIVGRFLENQAPTRPAVFAGMGSNGTTQASFPQVMSLANPLFSDGASTGDDQSCLTITVPVWGLTFKTNTAAQTYTIGVSYLVQNRIVAAFTATPQAMTLSFSQSGAAPPAINCGGHTYVGGPCPMLHDGNGLTEQNYHFGAHNLVMGGQSYSGVTATFNYYVVYRWVDGQGRLHRSQPSIATPVLGQSSSTPSNLTYWVARLNTSKALIGLQVIADIYCTIAGNTDDTAYLLDSVPVTAVPKTPGAPSMYVSLTPANQATIGNLTAQPALYTSPNASSSGATYYASPPRASFWQVAAKGRCFALVQISGQHRIYYSSIATDLYPFEWNIFNYAPVPPDVGDARSLEVVDDKVVVLGTRLNAVMTGDGPASGGTVSSPVPNDGFSPVTPIPVPAGVLGSGAPARIPDGIIYQGYSGIQVIGRDLSISPAGANVDVLTGRQIGNPGTIYGKGVTLPALQSVVWPNSRGAALVYSYLTQKWSTWPLLPNVAVMAQKMDGSVWAGVQPAVGTKMTPYGVGTAGADIGYLGAVYAPISGNSAAPGLVLETPWVLLAGASTGEADLWDMALVGTWQGPHTLKVEQAYNYGAYTLAQTLDMSSQPLTYQTRWRPAQNSRVWAVRYRVSLLPLTTLNAGYAMAALADLVIYSTNQTGTTRVAQGMTR